MKKAFALILCCVAVAGLLLVGCSGGDSSTASAAPEGTSSVATTSTPAPSTATASTADDATADASAPAAADGSVTVQDIVDEAQSQISSLNDSLGGTAEVAVTAEGDNTIVYTFTVLDASAGVEASAIEQQMTSMESMFTSLLDVLESAGIQSPVIKVTWVGADGSELYAKDFTK